MAEEQELLTQLSQASDLASALTLVRELERLPVFHGIISKCSCSCPAARCNRALVIGDVEEYGQHGALAERVWAEMQGLMPFELLEVAIDAYDQTAKTTRVWGEERKGRATPKDRVLVLRRVGARQGKGISPFTGGMARLQAKSIGRTNRTGKR